MPAISMFYGILIRMFFKDADRHHLPHIHAEYQGKTAVYFIPDGKLLAESVSPQRKNWLLPGSKSTRMTYLQIGNSLLTVKPHLRSED